METGVCICRSAGCPSRLVFAFASRAWGVPLTGPDQCMHLLVLTGTRIYVSSNFFFLSVELFCFAACVCHVYLLIIGIAPLLKACAGGASHIRVGARTAEERTSVAWRVVLSGGPYRAATCMTASLGAVRGKEKQLSSGSANPKHEIGKERTLWRAKH